MLSPLSVMLIIMSAFATALGSTLTGHAVKTCNPMSFRFTSLSVSVLIGILIIVLATSEVGDVVLGKLKPPSMYCSQPKNIALAIGAAVAFSISTALYLTGLHLSNGNVPVATSIMAPSVLVFSVLGGFLINPSNLNLQKTVGIAAALISVLILTQ